MQFEISNGDETRRVDMSEYRLLCGRAKEECKEEDENTKHFHRTSTVSPQVVSQPSYPQGEPSEFQIDSASK